MASPMRITYSPTAQYRKQRQELDDAACELIDALRFGTSDPHALGWIIWRVQAGCKALQRFVGDESVMLSPTLPATEGNVAGRGEGEAGGEHAP